MIDRFAEITGDNDFIHIDPERATRLGGTVAQGFLSLSLLPRLFRMSDPQYPSSVILRLNYGCNRARRVSPVNAGSRVRGHFMVEEIEIAFEEGLSSASRHRSAAQPRTAATASWGEVPRLRIVVSPSRLTHLNRIFDLPSRCAAGAAQITIRAVSPDRAARVRRASPSGRNAFRS
jgi:MaoC like domain